MLVCVLLLCLMLMFKMLFFFFLLSFVSSAVRSAPPQFERFLIAKCIKIFSSCSASFPAISYLFAELSHWISETSRVIIRIAQRARRHRLTSLTLILALADVSMNEQLNWFASDLPSSLPTTRSSSKSHLLPTKTIGTSSVSCVRNCLLKWLKLLAIRTHLNPQDLLSQVL